MQDQSVCLDYFTVKGSIKDMTEPCISFNPRKTFLQTYNCDFIRPPKPQRFERARKQIFRPSYVLSHFVHYSTVTTRLAETYSDYIALHPGSTAYHLATNSRKWEKSLPERFSDELTEGALIHARTVLPHETRRRSAECYLTSKYSCKIGYVCNDTVPFSDARHKDNVFENPDGSYCNCWKNRIVEKHLVPLLEKKLRVGS